jgi:RNA polymerase sigma-70 factor, ECF subfamily
MAGPTVEAMTEQQRSATRFRVDGTTSRYEADLVVAAATAGDRSAFSELVARYERELQVHTYRMLGSYEDSEDMTQETFARAWRMRETFEGRSSFRAWLYRIATNTTLSALERRTRRLETVPTDEVETDTHRQIAAADAAPDEELVSGETIELALLVAVQNLPPQQRAVLVARDLFGWSAMQTAALVGTTVAGVNSALHRARATMRTRLSDDRLEWNGPEVSEAERVLVLRYLDAVTRWDAEALAAMLREETRSTTPAERRCVEAA